MSEIHYFVLYNTDCSEYGSYVWLNTKIKSRAEKELARLKNMSTKKLASLLQCSESKAAKLRVHVTPIKISSKRLH